MGKERARGSPQRGRNIAPPRSSAPFRGLTNVAGFPRLTPWANLLRSYGALTPENAGNLHSYVAHAGKTLGGCPTLLDFHFPQPVRPFQHFSRLAAVGRADDAVALHHVQNARGPAVSQPQMALQGGGGSLAHLQHQAHGLFVHGVLLG